MKGVWRRQCEGFYASSNKHCMLFQSPSADGSPETMLPGLVKWKTPSKLLQSYGTGNFKFFMPPDLNYPIGDTYTILSPLPVDAPGMHMYRYHPFQPPPKEVFLFALLSQFHPYVFLQSRYGPRGSMAVVRARNDRYLDIMMRLEPPLLSLSLFLLEEWFSLRTRAVKQLNLDLPCYAIAACLHVQCTLEIKLLFGLERACYHRLELDRGGAP